MIKLNENTNNKIIAKKFNENFLANFLRTKVSHL